MRAPFLRACSEMVETMDDTRALARLCVVNILGDTVLEVASLAVGCFACDRAF